jgi:hypothetical protein
MVPGSTGGVPQGLFGPAVTTPTTAATTSAASGGRGGGLFQTQPANSTTGKGGRPSERSESDKKKDGEKDDEGPQNLARRETGNVWGYVKPNEDPYN